MVSVARIFVFVLAVTFPSFVFTASPQHGKPSSTVDGLFNLIDREIAGDEKMKDSLRKDFNSFQKLRNRNRKFHKQISAHIDFIALGTRSMPVKWRKKYWTGGRNKRALIHILKDLVEEIVYPQAKDFVKDHTLNHQKTTYSNGEKRAEVFYNVDLMKKSGKKETLPMVFYLEKNKSVWAIVDVLIEGQLWTDMFKNQFNHIITTKSYDDLIKRMRLKLNRVKSGTAF